MLSSKNTLYSLRKSSGLFQSDISFLLSYQDGSQISHLENGNLIASLRIAFAYQVLFKVSTAGLFPRNFKEVEESIRIRAGMLVTELEKQGANSSRMGRIAVLRDIETGRAARKHPIIFEDMKGAQNSTHVYEK